MSFLAVKLEESNETDGVDVLLQRDFEHLILAGDFLHHRLLKLVVGVHIDLHKRLELLVPHQLIDANFVLVIDTQFYSIGL